MSQIPSQKALELAYELDKLTPADQKRMAIFVELVANGDEQAIEIVDGISNGEITPEDALDLLDEYLASRH
jgi:hypothetical protein